MFLIGQMLLALPLTSELITRLAKPGLAYGVNNHLCVNA